MSMEDINNNFACRVFDLEIRNTKPGEDVSELFSRKNELSNDKFEILLNKIYKKALKRFIMRFESEFDNHIEIKPMSCAKSRFNTKSRSDTIKFDLALYGIVDEEIITTENIVASVAGRIAYEEFEQDGNNGMWSECKIKPFK